MKAYFLVIFWAAIVNAAYEFATTYKTCAFECYKKGGTHCIDETFTQSVCCQYPTEYHQERCTSRFKYCTTNLEQGSYKVFTCPMQDCPSGNKFFGHKHTRKNERVETEVKFSGWFRDPGYNCKIKIEAASHLNGKLIVEMKSVSRANLYVYQQPNTFSDDIGTHGIVENNQLYMKKNGKYTVPTDWSIYIVYLTQKNFGGEVVLDSYVTDYEDNDIRMLETMWQPTGTQYVNQTELRMIEEQKKAEEERIRQEQQAEKDRIEAERKAEEARIQREMEEAAQAAEETRLQELKDEEERLKQKTEDKLAEVDKETEEMIQEKEEEWEEEEAKKIEDRQKEVTEVALDEENEETVQEVLTQYKLPEGFYLNNTTLMFMIGVAVVIFILAICISCCIVRRYKSEKAEIQTGKFMELGPEVVKGEAFSIGQPSHNELDGQYGQGVFDFYNPNGEGEVVVGVLPPKKRMSKKVAPESPSLNSRRKKNKSQASGDFEEMEMRMQKKQGRPDLDILDPHNRNNNNSAQSASKKRGVASDKKLLDDLQSIASSQEEQKQGETPKRKSFRIQSNSKPQKDKDSFNPFS